MKRVIWKFRVPVADVTTIEVPDGAKILHVHEQGGEIMLWAEVDPGATIVCLPVWVVGTGGLSVPTAARYVGTAHVAPFVWHVYVPE